VTQVLLPHLSLLEPCLRLSPSAILAQPEQIVRGGGGVERWTGVKLFERVDVPPWSRTVAGCEENAEGAEEEATVSVQGGRTPSEDGDGGVEGCCGVVR
jgi:hypothetical protein